MSQKEVKKYDIIKKLIDNELNGSEAAGLLNLTVRQIRRLKGLVIEKGIIGLIHGNRGRASNRAISEEERKKVANLLHEKYPDFGPTFAAEKLLEINNIKLDPKTIRAIMIKEELWKPKYKKKETHREWRQRKAHKGEMIQYDGSYEYWFEDRGEKCCLLAGIDDANSEVWARFDEHEGVWPTFSFWREYINRFGKPISIYVDKFSTYSMNHKLAKENPDTLTQFERAMRELNIEPINANSPQAKGRVERLFRTLQDRLIKELRLNNISTVKEANEFLEKIFLPRFNAKFMVVARSKTNLHKKLNKQEEKKLDSVFSRQCKKVVMNDFTISHKKNCYQLEKIQPVTICKRDKVTIEERMDKSIKIRLRGKYLNHRLLPEKPKKINSSKKNLDWVIPKSSNQTVVTTLNLNQTTNSEYLKKLTKMSR